ncbi:unnamed protein product [Staurois parvus]|uniref:Ribulose-1,5-bisphosphate carboxylase/oxygenase large subunit n=1 Tax=Staurois parvus TaxID=386267 RepID=A0ABN9CSG2_9NEOB|nr:unnamed protein product [Staurois parvus]
MQTPPTSFNQCSAGHLEVTRPLYTADERRYLAVYIY